MHSDHKYQEMIYLLFHKYYELFQLDNQLLCPMNTTINKIVVYALQDSPHVLGHF